MQYLEEWLTTPDGHTIPVKVWRPRAPTATLVIAHGMAEHASRYAALADWLNDHDIAVVAVEHRGHSDDCPEADLGHYADQDGWNKVITDLDQVVDYARSLEPDAPLTLFGHSMGSFIVQVYSQRFGDKLQGLILCATNRINRPQLIVSKLLVNAIKAVKGPRHLSPLITNMTFGAFNKTFKPNRTTHDWLSRDNAQVDAYLDDAYCGFDCTVQLWSDFIGGLLSIDPHQWPKNLPVHVLSGTMDPVGEFGKGIGKHIEAFKAAGVNLASTRMFEGARHELVNETNALEVWEHLASCVAQP
ncbi:alpha/beta fold hydrolase [Saccharospirillum sp.]|uniref:alpha/beta fold hydrolase n=1 Tax=Saccharospirillum sp. TaxID=2033801 RepID=UPI0034A02AC8